MHVTGELDAESQPALREVLTSLALRGVTDIAVDMSACTFMDSGGLGALLAAHRQGAHLRIVNPSPRVEALLELVAVDTVIDIVRTDEG